MITSTFIDEAPQFPHELKLINRWIVRTADKLPYSAHAKDDNLGPIDPHDAQYQSDYDTALAAIELPGKYAGLGFVINYADGLTGFDFDDCVDNGVIRPDVLEIIKRADTYCEFSPSGRGIHAFAKGWQFPVDGTDPARREGSKVGKAEIYSGKRYFTVTGNQVPGTPSTVNDRDLSWLYDRIVLKREFVQAKTTASVAGSQNDSSCVVISKVDGLLLADKYETLMHGTVIRHKENGASDFAIEDAAQILQYESQSSADFALLRFITDRLQTEDVSAIKQEFLKSPLGQRSKARQGDYLDRSIKKLLQETRPGSDQMVLTAVAPTTPATPSVEFTEEIPEFDPSVITGIYKKIVDAVCDGTTIPRQFAFLAAKVFIGARMAGKVTFENMSADSSYYGTAIAPTGTGKGLAWRRTVEGVFLKGHLLDCGVKVIYSADSGAGVKDTFFEDPKDHPVIIYVDEITSLGHKAGEKKNPEIFDLIIELADSTRISRVLASRKGQKANRTHDNARLSLYMCGQNGEVFMSAFAGRTKLGIYDRLYPEYSAAVEAGDEPDVNLVVAHQIWQEFSNLKLAGNMTMAESVKTELDQFWKEQLPDIRKKPRFKKYLMLDMYMAAFGDGVMVAQLEHLRAAIKIYERQLVIRRVNFTTEVPDKVGLYIGRLKTIFENARRRLNTGGTIGEVALSIRDLQTSTMAYKENELQTFNTAWRNFEMQVSATEIVGRNGQKYKKYVPVPDEHEIWAP